MEASQSRGAMVGNPNNGPALWGKCPYDTGQALLWVEGFRGLGLVSSPGSRTGKLKDFSTPKPKTGNVQLLNSIHPNETLNPKPYTP